MATEKQNFVNQQLRPIAELLEQLDIRITALNSGWTGGLSGQFVNGATPYVDGRTEEGLAQFAESLVHGAVTTLVTLQTNSIIPIRSSIRKMAVRLPV